MHGSGNKHQRSEGQGAFRREVDAGKYLTIQGGRERGDMDENISARPDGRGGKVGTTISGGGSEPAPRKEEVQQKSKG